MIDLNKIHKLLKKHFIVQGDAHVDAQTGVVDVKGHVFLNPKKIVSQLPVQFGHVTGHFHCHKNQLNTLLGCPTRVTESFCCAQNQLQTLEGAPDYVRGNFQCNGNPLKSLQGAPDFVGGEWYLDYDPELPLLRTLNAERVFMWPVPQVVIDTLKKYKGEGKPGALKCAAELIRAGFMDNARW
jgi:hypothetical protein